MMIARAVGPLAGGRALGALPVAALLLGAGPLRGQDEAELRRFFEGMTVVVKLDMPATEDGVDVFPARDGAPVDYPKYARRIKRHGVALPRGDSVLVTRVKVKDDLIEFQLAGGGWGTFGDETDGGVYAPHYGKGVREKELERERKETTDAARRKEIEAELDRLRRERESRNAELEILAEQAEEHRRSRIRERALGGGSRFNLRYPGGTPADALSPGSVMGALERLVEFPGDGTPTDAPPLRKGLLRAEVDALLGPAAEEEVRREGRLEVRVAVYRTAGGELTAEFVEGVLVRFDGE